VPPPHTHVHAHVRPVRQHPELSEWRLYLASWGYCTPDEVESARGVQGVTVLGLKHFTELLRWGLVAGVGDGCEPTDEEVAAGVDGGAGRRLG
jgi:hypothetical protein